MKPNIRDDYVILLCEKGSVSFTCSVVCYKIDIGDGVWGELNANGKRWPGSEVY